MTTTVRFPKLGLKALLPATLLLLLIPAADASAGRLLVTGHDWDLHCSFGQQCHYSEVGINFVRGDSNKKVLVVDKLTPGNNDIDVTLDNVYGEDFPRRIVDPQTAAWRDVRLTTKKFSAILVASDFTCGGCDLNGFGDVADSIEINKRKAAIRRYFNQGGGIMVGAGASHGDGNEADDIYYNFVPIPVGGVAVSAPFCLTNRGIALGFHDQECPDASKHNGTEDDINCCATHNSFNNPPANSALKVAERDSEGFAETLFARGKIKGGKIVQPLRLKVSPKEAPQGKHTCFVLRVRSEGDPLNNATVKFGGKKKKTNRRGKVTICATFGETGRQRAKATKRGFASDTASVNIFPVAAAPCPRKAARC